MDKLKIRFERWWRDEGSRGRKANEQKYDDEEFIYVRCKEAWTNGAYVQEELSSTKNTKH